ncbi:MAG: response regulator [Bryobacteraceae bacterium]
MSWGFMGHKRSAIIADDSAAMRRFIRRILQSANLGFERFREAENGAEAMELALQEQPDLILTDLQMPKMDGAGLLAKLGGIVSIVVVSTDADLEAVQSLGAKGCVRKPFTRATLVAEVQRVLAMVLAARDETSASHPP